MGLHNFEPAAARPDRNFKVLLFTFLFMSVCTLAVEGDWSSPNLNSCLVGFGAGLFVWQVFSSLEYNCHNNRVKLCTLHCAHCMLQIACCKLHVANCMEYIACCKLHAANCMLEIACCDLHVSYCVLQIVCCKLHVARERERFYFIHSDDNSLFQK